MKLKIPKLFRSSKQKVTTPSVVEEVPRIEQPQPFDPDGVRYCSQRPFPPYRHVPGVTPHPIRDPQGHSHGLEEDDSPVSLPAAWHQTEDYLYGVDLFNFAYWWEAHEAWEGLWNKTEDDCRLFLQGLIQISAALIKYHMRQLRGLQSLSTNGRTKLLHVLTNLDDPTGIYMGVNLPEFLTCLDTFFEPFFCDTVSEQTYMHVTVKPLIPLHLQAEIEVKK